MTETEWLASEDPAAMMYYLVGGSEGLEGNSESWKASKRKFRLLSVAIAFPFVAAFPAEADMELLLLAEQLADGGATSRDRGIAFNKTDGLHGYRGSLVRNCLRSNPANGAYGLCREPVGEDEQEPKRQAAILRDIVGNPFRPVVLPPGPDCHICGGKGKPALHCEECGNHGHFGRLAISWLTPTVVSLAHAAYDHRDPQTRHLDPFRLSLVADALEEAGCDAVKCHDCEGSGVCMTRPRDPVRLGRGWPCKLCKATGSLPHPILDHLRSPDPHVRGCWAIDLVLGRV